MMTQTILVVDDDVQVRKLVKEMLQISNIEDVTLAADGENALQHLKQSEFDFITLDLHMPGINGIDLLVEMGKIKPDIRCVIISAVADDMMEASVKLAKECGVDVIGSLKKPFRLEQLQGLLGLKAA